MSNENMVCFPQPFLSNHKFLNKRNFVINQQAPLGAGHFTQISPCHMTHFSDLGARQD